MGFVLNHKRAGSSGNQEEPDKTPPQLEGLTNLTALLMGYQEKPGVFVKGLTLTIWWADGRLKFSANDKANNLVGFGVIKGDQPLGDAIEMALEGEEIEWKEKDERRR